MSESELQYAEAEHLLAHLHGADEKVRTGAFRGRLKHLKRLGIPLDSNPGRGAKITYTQEQVWQWAFCLELAEFGIDPTIIVQLVKTEWEARLLPEFRKASAAAAGDDVYFIATPRLMESGWDSKSTRAIEISWFHLKVSDSVLWRIVGTKRRAIILNASDLCRIIDGIFRVKPRNKG
ncbi:hypothetical protein [Bradyrhizobium sp. AZCC 2289]|uniref:hypothetical protein n=1 Tax=Bradyrhizobium sp. AZCC 2289 TaxID=3117026 RepID=UPI002FF06BAF